MASRETSNPALIIGRSSPILPITSSLFLWDEINNLRKIITQKKSQGYREGGTRRKGKGGGGRAACKSFLRPIKETSSLFSRPLG